MKDIQEIVDHVVYIDDEGKAHPISVSYRNEQSNEIPTPKTFPLAVVTPTKKGYDVLTFCEKAEHDHQIREQIIGRFINPGGKNQKENLQLKNVKPGSHGTSIMVEFEIEKV